MHQASLPVPALSLPLPACRQARLVAYSTSLAISSSTRAFISRLQV
jgi:hypothetical protein